MICVARKINFVITRACVFVFTPAYVLGKELYYQNLLFVYSKQMQAIDPYLHVYRAGHLAGGNLIAIPLCLVFCWLFR